MLLYLVFLFVFSVCSIFIGSLFFYQTDDNYYSAKFKYAFFGSLFIGVVYALLKTSGFSYLSIIVLLALVYMLITKKIIFKINRKFLVDFFYDYKFFLLLFIYIAFAFSIQFFRVSDLDGNIYKLHGDLCYYGRLAFFISESGWESHGLNVFNFIKGVPDKYHYLEIWQTALVGNLFNLNMTLSLYLIVIPFYYVLCFIGLLGYFQKKMPKLKSWTFFIAPFVLFISNVSFLNITTLASSVFKISEMSEALYNFPKLSVVCCCLVLLLNVGVKPCLKFGFYVSIMGLLFPTIVPALFMGYVLWLILLYMLNKEIKLKKIFLSSLFPILASLLYAGYYVGMTLLFKNTEQHYHEMYSIFDFYLSRYGMVSMAYILIFVSALVISTLSLYALVFFYIIGKRNFLKWLKNEGGFFLIIIIGGIFSYVFLYKMFDSVQLFQNIFVPVISISVVLLSFYVFKNNYVLYKKGLVLFLLLLNILTNVIYYKGPFKKGVLLNDVFYNKIITEVRKSTNPRFGFIKQYNDAMSASTKNPLIGIPGYHFSMFSNEFLPVCFSVFDIPINDDAIYYDVEKSRVFNSIFYQFVEKEKENGILNTIEKSITSFVLMYKVNFIFIDQGLNLPEELLRLPHKTFINKDEGYSVVIFSYT